MREFVIQLGHRPGELARVTNALSLYGVNIKSVAAMTIGDQATSVAPADAGSRGTIAVNGGSTDARNNELGRTTKVEAS